MVKLRGYMIFIEFHNETLGRSGTSKHILTAEITGKVDRLKVLRNMIGTFRKTALSMKSSFQNVPLRPVPVAESDSQKFDLLAESFKIHHYSPVSKKFTVYSTQK